MAEGGIIPESQGVSRASALHVLEEQVSPPASTETVPIQTAKQAVWEFMKKKASALKTFLGEWSLEPPDDYTPNSV